MHKGRGNPDRGTQPFVRINDDRVDQFQPVIKIAQTLIQNAGQPVGTIHMQPDPVFSRELTNGTQWINCTHVGAAQVSNDRHRQYFIPQILFNS